MNKKLNKLQRNFNVIMTSIGIIGVVIAVTGCFLK